jgi:hypothetical protein
MNATRMLLGCSLGMVVGAFAVQGRSTGQIPPTLAGVPGESLCTQCHTGNAVNSGPGRLTVTILRDGSPVSSYLPATRYTVRVVLQDPDAQRWGFMVSPRRADTAQPAGAVAITDAANTQLRTGANGIEGVAHTPDGTRPGNRNQSQWEFDWTSPASPSGTLTFFAAGNAANNSTNNQGDRIYTAALQLMAAGDAPTVTQVLARLAIGTFDSARFQTAIYFHNPNDSAASITVNTFDMNGAPLLWAPDTGGAAASLRTLSVPAGGTAVLRSQDAGAGLVGWARIAAPRGVIGYGIYRQSVSGRADQEAIVPFTSDGLRNSWLVFDNSNSMTTVVLTNPAETASTVTIAMKDEAGQALGTASINLPPRSSVANLLSELAPGLGSAAGKRGTAMMSASGGSISAASLRFLSDAFGSIPVAAQ